MRKDLKNRIVLSSAIDKELHAWLKDYSNKTDIPMSKLLDQAIRLLIKEKEEPK